jgi:LacI family transcriptional regulator
MTISKALRNHSDIKLETREKVQALAKELGYKPNYVARNLSSRKTYMIGVVMPKIAHSFYSSVLDGIQNTAKDCGYEIALMVSRESAQKEEKDIRTLISMRVDGLLVSVSQETSPDSFRDVKNLGIPLVFFDRSLDDMGCSSVVVDDRGGAKSAVLHAFSLGYRRIMHFAGYRNVDISRQRLAGYIDAHDEVNIPVDDNLIIESGFGEAAGYRSFLDVFKSGTLPEVIFSVSDSVACGVYRAAKDLDLQIGSDFGLIGFTDINVASILSPPLTTVHEPAEKMGKEAANLLVQEIEGMEPADKRQIVLPAELKIRESCGELEK